MDDKYENKYRVQSTRLNGWDYGSHGLYFVTVCTKGRMPYFGQIENNVQETQSIGNYIQVYTRLLIIQRQRPRCTICIMNAKHVSFGMGDWSIYIPCVSCPFICS